MGGSGEVAEAAVVAAAVERGFVAPAQVEAARQACAAWAAAGTPVSLLALVSARHLDERQRDALRAVYRAALARERPATVVGLDPRAGAVDPHEETQALDRPRVPAGPPPPVQLRVPSILAKRPSGGASAAPPARPPSGGTPAARPLSVTHLGDGPLPPPSAALDPAATRLDPGSVVARGAPTGTTPGADGRTVADGLPAAPKAPPPGDATWWQASLEGEAPAAPGAPAAPQAGAGARLGRWELVAELGRGAMGVVYEARDPGLDRRVALKVLLAGAGASPTDVARFQLEGKAAARLDHPAIVRVIDLAADDEGRWLLALELVRGESLISRLRRAGPLPWREVAKLGRTLAEALAHAHEQGVLHRDVKPHNVLLGADGQARLADFGLAKLQGGKALTAAGAVLGTPAYMAPEQVDPDRGEPDARADLYALGATLYHALAGRPPFVAASPSALLHAVQFTEPDPPSLHRGASPDEAPPDLERVVLRCLAKSPGGRYGSGSALADDLGRVLGGTRLPLDAGATVASGARRAAEAGPSRRSAWLVGAACVVVGVGGGLLIVGWRAFQQERDRRAEAEHVAALERDARQAVGGRVTETPPATEPAPPPTEASPPATEASPPATEPPPPPTEASPPVTEPSPPATEPPPPASEPPPPATEPPPTEPSPPASAPELGPGEWLRARLLVPAGEVPWTAFEAGLVEARARNVPLVVFAVSVSLEQDDEFPTLFRDPEVAELLTSAVVAVGSQHVDAQHAHTETLSPGGQPRCRLWRTVPCATHVRARQEASQRGADVSDLDGAWRLLVVSPDGAVRALLGPAGQTRRGEPVPTYSPRALAAAVEALQRELGPPVPLPDLLDAGRRLLAAEGRPAGDAREVAASLRGDERAGGVLARWADELARRAAR